MLKRYPGQDIIDYRLFSAGATGFVSARGVTSRDDAPKVPIGQWLSTYVVLNSNSIGRLSACMPRRYQRSHSRTTHGALSTFRG